MPRFIRFFNIDDESYTGEEELPELPLELLQHLYNESKGNPMYDSYPIKEEHIEFFLRYIDFKFNFQTFDYYLEYDS